MRRPSRLLGATARLVVATGLLLAGAVVAATSAHAEDVNALTVDATVNADTSLHVVETIDYDFEGSYRHGIFRDLPVYDETLTGQRRSYTLEVESVSMDGAVVPWQSSDEGPFRRLKIGDPNQTITGPHTYVITYTVGDALRIITDSDTNDPQFPANVTAGDVELFWDLVGTGWEVPINYAAATVSGPGQVLSAKCYSGASGSTATCPVQVSGPTAALGPVGLGSFEGMTGAIVYPRAAFAVPPTENVSQQVPSNPIVGIGLALIPAAVIVIVPAVIAVRLRRNDLGAPVPGAPPQYTPPDGLTPAELYAAWQGDAGSKSSRIMLATLLDLTGRRWIDLSSPDDKHLTVTWRGTGEPAMRPWEEHLLALVLKGQASASLTTYDAALATGWKSDFRSLVAAQEADGRRNPRGGEPDKRWGPIGLAATLTLGAAIVSTFLHAGFLTAILFTLGGATLVSYIVARTITPRQETPQSATYLAKVAGFQKVLGTDPAAGRREFAQRSGLAPAAIFATMLPYAVVFSLEKSWIGAFPDLTPDDLVSSGFYVPTIAMMDSFVSTSASSMSSATTAPSSGSGSGGSSGGGGGGGGGGSW
jgi:uncharacterized membrane protein YgcG